MGLIRPPPPQNQVTHFDDGWRATVHFSIEKTEKTATFLTSTHYPSQLPATSELLVGLVSAINTQPTSFPFNKGPDAGDNK